jgi:hypothetical protein
LFSYGGGQGGPTIFDVPSGALSYKSEFIDLYTVLEQDTQGLLVLDAALFEVYEVRVRWSS